MGVCRYDTKIRDNGLLWSGEKPVSMATRIAATWLAPILPANAACVGLPMLRRAYPGICTNVAGSDGWQHPRGSRVSHRLQI